MAYEPLNIYDAPGAIASQLLGGVGSFKAIKDTFFSPDNLTPEERMSLTDRLTGGSSDGLSKALLNVATNPWVWLMFLTSPVGAKALAGGRSFWSVAPEYAAQVKKAGGFFSWARTPLEDLKGTNATNIALGVSDALHGMSQQASMGLLEAQGKLQAHIEGLLGGKQAWSKTAPLASSSYTPGTPLYNAVRGFEGPAAIRAHGLDRDVVDNIRQIRHTVEVRQGLGEWTEALDPLVPDSQDVTLARLTALKEKSAQINAAARETYFSLEPSQRARWGNVGNYVQEMGFHVRSGTPAVTSTEKARQAIFDRGAVDQALDLYGEAGRSYIHAADQVRKQEFVRNLGDEDHFLNTGQFKVDRDKAGRLSSALGRNMHAQGLGPNGFLHAGSTSLQGKEAVLSLMGSDRMEQLMKLPPEDRVDALVSGIEELVSPQRWDGELWASRNTFAPNPVMIGNNLKAPPLKLSSMASINLDQAPYAASANLSGHVFPITDKDLVLNTREMQEFGHLLTNHGQESLAGWSSSAQKAFTEQGRPVMGLTLRHDDMHWKYVRNVQHSTVYDTMPATQAMLRGDEEARLLTPAETLTRETVMGGAVKRKVGDSLAGLSPEELKLVSPGDLMDRMYEGLQSEGHRAVVRDVLVPGALNNAGPEYLTVYESHIRSKQMAQTFADSWMGKAIERMGDAPKAFIERTRQYASFENQTRAKDFAGGLAKYLYVTHLGVNMASMVMNMTQPLLLAATAGTLPEVLGAYGDAIGEMGSYAKKRVSAGKLFIDPAAKLKMMEESFTFMGKGSEGRNLIGIGPDSASVFDSVLHSTTGTPMERAADLMLSGFEKTEWFNRNFAAHLFKRISTRGGMVPPSHYLEDMQRFVLQTQFGQNSLNTPMVFLKQPFSSPLLRQFMGFSLRSLTGVVDTFAHAGGESYMRGLGNTVLRGMGMSAMVYEIGKGLVGADMSRGLFANAVTSIVGGDRFLEKGSNWIPLPPIISIPVGVIQGVAQGDGGLLVNSIARVVPGGVALNRAMGVMPDLTPRLGGVLGGLQKTYADYDNPLPTGEVPVYKGDGSLIEYRKPSELVAKGLGVDLGTWEQQGGLDNYLVKQRDQIVQYRHEWLRQMAANNPGQAASVAAEFSKRFKGVPLTVTPAQIDDYMRNRVVGRTERTLDRIPREVRPMYQQFVAQSGGAGNLPREAITAQQSAAGRNDARLNDPMREADMRKRLESVGGAASQSGGAFDSFRTF